MPEKNPPSTANTETESPHPGPLPSNGGGTTAGRTGASQAAGGTEVKGPPFWTFTLLLMMGLAVSFAVQQLIVVRKGYEIYLALSGYGVKSLHLWEFFTYQFMHCGPIHLAVNLVGLWCIARPAEFRLGRKWFLVIYLGSVLAGAVLQGGVALAGFVLPESIESVAGFLRDKFGGMAAGSSVGLCGVFAACCFLPAEPGSPALFRLKPSQWLVVLILVVIFAVHSLFVSTHGNFDLPHLAHLGGLLAGATLVRIRNPKSEIRTKSE
jgi:membrane associated rhomboid family serine protease